jgi:4-amino-4-deoxy-L-arabinose transferase-like glycosyltransferase
MDISQTEARDFVLETRQSLLIKNRIITATYCFLGFISLHLIVWTILPTLLRSTLPIDALEGFVWGNQLEWGYDRNPWLNGWLTRLAMEIGGHHGWMTYLFSQLCVVMAFWSVWQLGKKIFSPWQALIAVMMLEAIQYYTLAAVNFDDNILELGLWPLLALYFYQAVIRQNARNWVAVGIIAALALMAKYYTAIYLLSLLIFLIIDPKARCSFRQKNFYLGAIVFTIIILPHCIWLFFNHFETIRYAMYRVGENTHINVWHYIQPTVKFAFMQLLNFVGAAFLFMLIIPNWMPGSTAQIPEPNLNNNDQPFNKRFLWVVGSGTYLLTLIIALITGWQLHVLWGMPLLSLWGLILLTYIRPNLSPRKLLQFFTAVSVVFISYVLAYCIPMLQTSNCSSANFPAAAVSNRVMQLWQQQYHHPLHYLAGDRYLAGYISLYADHYPAVYMDWDQNKSPWIDEGKLRREGAVFVQLVSDGKEFPASILQRFPQLQILPMQTFRRPRSNENSQPVELLIGFLPPIK